jgi:hypothetical protein
MHMDVHNNCYDTVACSIVIIAKFETGGNQ